MHLIVNVIAFSYCLHFDIFSVLPTIVDACVYLSVFPAVQWVLVRIHLLDRPINIFTWAIGLLRQTVFIVCEQLHYENVYNASKDEINTESFVQNVTSL